MYRTPFRAIHFRCTNDIGGQAGIDQHLSLIGEPNASGLAGALKRWVGMIQREPVATAIRVETRNVEDAIVQQAPVAALRPIFVAADVLVDVLVLRVVA